MTNELAPGVDAERDRRMREAFDAYETERLERLKVNRYACCECCANGVDPDLHAQMAADVPESKGKDFHDAECTLCGQRASAPVARW